LVVAQPSSEIPEGLMNHPVLLKFKPDSTLCLISFPLFSLYSTNTECT
jgi:hypothetical protein